MNQLSQAINDEVASLISGIRVDASDPAKRAEIAAMAMDAAMLPMRIAAGENVDEIAAALKAEAMNLTLAEKSHAISLAKTAVFNVLGALLRAAVGV